MLDHNHTQIRSIITQSVPHGAPVILGLSGGPDSVYLLQQLLPLHAQGIITLIAAHLDHEWRTDSADDAAFCRTITANLGITCIIAKASDLSTSIKCNGSKEEVGRRLRRHFFELLARKHNASAIILAHHADDQQETFFLRLFRGCTLTGLSSMRTRSGLYLRPLLSIFKKEIITFLDTHSIPYRTDPTNNHDCYLRNRIRSSVIPALRTTDSRFDTTFSNLVSSLQETDDFLNDLAETTLQNLTVSIDGKSGLSISQLLALNSVLAHRVILLWLYENKATFVPSKAFLHELFRFLRAYKSNVHTITAQWSLYKKSGNLFFLKN